jgi:hypothetical protein
MGEVLRFDDLAPYLLLKNGNYLYKVPFRGGHAVLKVYYGSRGPIAHALKSIENVVFAGQSSYMPKTRLRVERECMALWRRHGFRVFEVYDDVTVEAPRAQCPPGGYLLVEYVEAPKILAYLSDEAVPLERKLVLYRRFLADWGRRHALAIQHREPRLVHENGDGKHVMLVPGEAAARVGGSGTGTGGAPGAAAGGAGGADLDALTESCGFLWFDFEMVYRSRAKVPDHVSHEIAQYLWHTLKTVPPAVAEALLEETVRSYPDRGRLERVYDYFFRHPNPLHRLGRAIDRGLLGRGRKATSKYNVVRRLKERLARP